MIELRQEHDDRARSAWQRPPARSPAATPATSTTMPHQISASMPMRIDSREAVKLPAM